MPPREGQEEENLFDSCWFLVKHFFLSIATHSAACDDRLYVSAHGLKKSSSFWTAPSAFAVAIAQSAGPASDFSP